MGLGYNRYGKQRVRVLRVNRDGTRHELREITASVLLEGVFDKSFLSDDNSQVVPTDTVKNTVTVLAQDNLKGSVEDFALFVARHFLKKYDHITAVHVDLEEKTWQRLTVDGELHPHAFVEQGQGTPVVSVVAARDHETIVSGVTRLLVLKSTASAFVGYPKCDMTTLPETNDRIFSTSMDARWTWAKAPADHRAANQRILDTMLGVFAREFSPSVQRTLLQMGEAALAAVPEIARVDIKMPNKHYIPVNLKPFNRENPGEVFLPTDEPHGEIEAVVTR